MRAPCIGGSLLLVLLGGCGSPALPAYPLTSRVLDVMHGARPYQLRMGATQRHNECGEVSTPTLVSFVCPPSRSTDAASGKLAELAPTVLATLRGKPDADALWAAALLDLWSGRQDARLLDRAIARLSEVRSRDTSTTTVLSHLAVAHAARAAVRNDPRDLYGAVDLIERASARDRGAPDIAFNRAVLLSAIRMDRQAAKAAATLDADSPWAIELADATGKSPDRASGEVAAFDPQAAREYVLDTLLASWASSRLSGRNSQADSLASHATSIARRILQATGDSSVTHIARDLTRQDGQSVPEGVQAYTAGMRQYAIPAWGPAGDSLRKAARLLRRAGANTLASLADNHVAAVHMASGDIPRAIDGFTEVARDMHARGDRALEARALWGRGIAFGRGRSMTNAARDIAAAESMFVTSDEVMNGARLRITLGEIYGFLGRSDDAARAFHDGFSRKPALIYEDLLALAPWMGESQPWALAIVMRELTMIAATSSRPKDLPESMLRLAQAQAAIGDDSSATATLHEARHGSALVTDSTFRSRLDAELDRAEADLIGRTDPRTALTRVNAARRYFKALPLEDAGLLLRRSRLSLAIGDSGQANRDLTTALGLVRDLGVAAGGVTDRPLAATTREANRALIALALARGDTVGAWKQTIAMTGTRSSSAPASGTAELRFVVLPDRILTWHRSPEALTVTSSPIAQSELTMLVGRFSNLLRTGDDAVATDSLSRRLFGLLLSSHALQLGRSSRLDVVGDGVLNDVPVAFLRGAQGRVVEHAAVQYLTAGSASRPRASGNLAARGPLLVVNPEWNRSTFPGLEPLRWAESETRAIAALRPGATVISGVEATKSAVTTALPRYDVVHFTGHARVVTERPASSHLVVASAGGTFSDGALLASDVAKLPLHNVRLVVLSACGRSTTSSNAIGQANGLTTAFLEAGVSTVLSGLWEIDDEITARLMTSVHTNLAQGLSPAESLRQAQLSLLKEGGADGHSLSVAAAFVVHTGRN